MKTLDITASRGVTRPPKQRPTVFQNKEDTGNVHYSERERQTATEGNTRWPYNTARVKKNKHLLSNIHLFSFPEGHEKQKIPQLLAAQK